MTSRARDLVVMVTGATGAAGRSTCAALAAAGHRVIAVGRDEAALADVRADRIFGRVCELTDQVAVADLVRSVREEMGAIDGLVHLVGGWRGGSTFSANTEQDWTFLSANLIDTLRHVTLQVHDDLLASEFGRAVIVSAQAARRPTAGNANYATAKAAAEAWLQALADSLRRNQSGKKDDPRPQTSAAVILVVKAIGEQAGFTTTRSLADRITGLFDADAAELNGARIDLSARS
jgi:NADP-dependent 3-hydroxy acid dehydrogenase YdfG